MVKAASEPPVGLSTLPAGGKQGAGKAEEEVMAKTETAVVKKDGKKAEEKEGGEAGAGAGGFMDERKEAMSSQHQHRLNVFLPKNTYPTICAYPIAFAYPIPRSYPNQISTDAAQTERVASQEGCAPASASE